MTATTNIARTYKQSTPSVSYMKAADVWLWTCQAIVFAVFLEFGLVNVVNRKFNSSKKVNTFIVT